MLSKLDILLHSENMGYMEEEIKKKANHLYEQVWRTLECKDNS